MPAKPDKYDPYRESLVVETVTDWSAVAAPPPAERKRLEEALHADPAACSHLQYERVHTGFCRIVVVTDADLQRVGVKV